MRGARASINLLRSLVRNSGGAYDGGVKGGSDLVGSLLRITATEEGHRLQWHVFSSRSFASDADKGSFPTDEVSSGEEPENKNKEGAESKWPILEGEHLSAIEQQGSSSREGGSNSWFIPEVKKQLDKENISRWFLPKDAEGSTEQERQEISSKEVGAR